MVEPDDSLITIPYVPQIDSQYDRANRTVKLKFSTMISTTLDPTTVSDWSQSVHSVLYSRAEEQIRREFKKENKYIIDALLEKAKYTINYHKSFTVLDLLLHDSLKSENIEVSERLLKKGANLNYNIWGYKDQCPLYYFVSYGSVPAVKFLIDHGADINQKLLVSHTSSMGVVRIERESVLEHSFDNYRQSEPFRDSNKDLEDIKGIEYLVSRGAVCFYTDHHPLIRDTWFKQGEEYRQRLSEVLRLKHSGPEVSGYIVDNAGVLPDWAGKPWHWNKVEGVDYITIRC